MIKNSLFATVLCFGLVACGTQQPAKVNSYGVSKGAGSTGIHTVAAGDTVYKIAQNYRLPMREIITLNHIEAPYTLTAGLRMKLPPPNEYTVRHGDTVGSIARMYEVPASQIVRLNQLEPPYKLMVRQKLRLPSKGEKKKQIQPTRYIEPAHNARIGSVEKQALDQSAKTAVTPGTKPAQVQKASTAVRTRLPKLPKTTPKMSGNGKFMRPVNGKVISNYGAKAGGLFNDGINIKATRGTAVRAAENGVVVYTGDDLEGYGNLILVRHANKLMSAYAHLDKTLIKRGDKVMRGQSIGTVGSSGQVDSPQLHFEIRRGSTALDPAKYL